MFVSIILFIFTLYQNQNVYPTSFIFLVSKQQSAVGLNCLQYFRFPLPEMENVTAHYRNQIDRRNQRATNDSQNEFVKD